MKMWEPALRAAIGCFNRGLDIAAGDSGSHIQSIPFLEQFSMPLCDTTTDEKVGGTLRAAILR